MVDAKAAAKEYVYSRHKPEETTLYKIVQDPTPPLGTSVTTTSSGV